MSTGSEDITRSVECRLVMARLNRYLVGEVMPEALLSEVERHVIFCSDCQSKLTQRKAALKSMLKSHSQEKFEVSKKSDSPEQLQKKAMLISFLTAKQTILDEKSEPIIQEYVAPKQVPLMAPAVFEAPVSVMPPKSESVPRPLQWKSLSMAAVAAIGLVGMSYVGADPTTLFGQKAIPSEKKLAPVMTVTEQPMVTESVKADLYQSLKNQETPEVVHKESLPKWLQNFDESPVVSEKPSIVLDFVLECAKQELRSSEEVPVVAVPENLVKEAPVVKQVILPKKVVQKSVKPGIGQSRKNSKKSKRRSSVQVY